MQPENNLLQVEFHLLLFSMCRCIRRHHSDNINLQNIVICTENECMEMCGCPAAGSWDSRRSMPTWPRASCFPTAYGEPTHTHTQHFCTALNGIWNRNPFDTIVSTGRDRTIQSAHIIHNTEHIQICNAATNAAEMPSNSSKYHKTARQLVFGHVVLATD